MQINAEEIVDAKMRKPPPNLHAWAPQLFRFPSLNMLHCDAAVQGGDTVPSMQVRFLPFCERCLGLTEAL